MNDPEISIKWDKTIKKYTILEKSESSIVFHKIFHSPMPFISERDRVDKMISFEIRNRVFSIMSSADDYIPEVDNIIRMKNYLSLFSYYIRSYKGERYIVFYGFNQLDTKIKLPEKSFSIFLSLFNNPTTSLGSITKFLITILFSKTFSE